MLPQGEDGLSCRLLFSRTVALSGRLGGGDLLGDVMGHPPADEVRPVEFLRQSLAQFGDRSEG